MSGIYLHIPFCHKACHYCDFHFSTNLNRKDDMVGAIMKEIDLRQSFLEEPLQTIYFGGGTPSLLEIHQLGYLLNHISQRWSLDEEVEITLEANPEDLSKNYLAGLKSLGINRLSIGIQTLDDQSLNFMNRAHNAQEAIRAVDEARSAGFDNISLDLIFGRLDHDTSKLEKDLQQFSQWKPEHISAYNLTIEQGTAFGNWANKGKIPQVNDEQSTKEFYRIEDFLQELDYEHYETSNYAQPGFRSRHNSSYWNRKPYLGVGPGAHSFKENQRSFNVSNNSKYINAIQSGTLPIEHEILSETDIFNEYVMISLRKIEGMNLEMAQSLCPSLEENHMSLAIEPWANKGMAEINSKRLIITAKGKVFIDQIAQSLFL